MVVDLEQRAKHPALSAGRAAAAQAAEEGRAIRRACCSGIFDRHPVLTRAACAAVCPVCVRLAAVRARLWHEAAPHRPFAASARKQIEAQRACDRNGLHQPHRDAVAEPIGFAGRASDHGVAILVILEIVVADIACRYESIRAGFVKLHEQSGARDAADAALEGRADPVGEIMRDQPVDGLALGRHRAPFRGGNAGRNFVQRRRRRRSPASAPSPSLSARISARCTIRSA